MKFPRIAGMSLLCCLLALVVSTGTIRAELTYTVVPGDKLSEIAQRFSVPLDGLVSLNNIENPDLIYVGQVLKLPADAVIPSEARDNPAEQPPAEEVTNAPNAEAAATPAEDRPLTARELAAERQRIVAERRGLDGDKLVEDARNLLGTPYVRGGLSSRGMDCSGLVVRVMRNQGRNVPHHAATLFTMGQRVTYNQLQPGDLLFFNTNGRGVSHVGIWIGDNKFVHASTRGRGVVIDKVERYHARRLVGARRLQ